MKRLTMILSIMLLFATMGLAQQKQGDMTQKRQQMMEMMQDSTMRAMMMEHMAQNPQMRQQMMQSMKMDSTMMMGNMKEMMNNPQMKERMQKHMEMMQSMMDGNMDHSKMMNMMGDSSMMKMHMMCMQMMQGDMTGGQGMMNKEDSMKGNDHKQHHN